MVTITEFAEFLNTYHLDFALLNRYQTSHDEIPWNETNLLSQIQYAIRHYVGIHQMLINIQQSERITYAMYSSVLENIVDMIGLRILVLKNFGGKIRAKVYLSYSGYTNKCIPEILLIKTGNIFSTVEYEDLKHMLLNATFAGRQFLVERDVSSQIAQDFQIASAIANLQSLSIERERAHDAQHIGFMQLLGHGPIQSNMYDTIHFDDMENVEGVRQILRAQAYRRY
jgi:hypothetical protein